MHDDTLQAAVSANSDLKRSVIRSLSLDLVAQYKILMVVRIRERQLSLQYST